MGQVVRDNPKTHTGWTAAALSFREFQYGSFRAPLLALFAAMALLILIASANIASLTLANVSARRGEIALRRAIGASSGALARLVVIEVAVLNLAGVPAEFSWPRCCSPHWWRSIRRPPGHWARCRSIGG